MQELEVLAMLKGGRSFHPKRGGGEKFFLRGWEAPTFLTHDFPFF